MNSLLFTEPVFDKAIQFSEVDQETIMMLEAPQFWKNDKVNLFETTEYDPKWDSQ